MLDYRHETFLALCAIGSYTKTAQHLHLSQPAVTQHIQFLEAQYKCQLVRYENKQLALTPAGEELRGLLTRIEADAQRFRRSLDSREYQREELVFGATLSIGEYFMPRVIPEMLKESPRLNIHMEVGNSRVLLEKLRQGELDFALIEGVIDKSKYHSLVFSLERFVGICAPGSELTRGTVDFQALLKYPLILREQGSGTREIFENILKAYNFFHIEFRKRRGNREHTPLGRSQYLGIPLYEIALTKKSNKETYRHSDRLHVNAAEFNFVFLQDSAFTHKYLD